MITLICCDRRGVRTIDVNPDKLKSMFRRHEIEKLRAGLVVRKGGVHRSDAHQRKVYKLEAVAA